MADGGIVFTNLRVNGWRQFQEVDINFHDRLTVITGTNGAGKSTILNILSRHVGISRNYYALPQRDGEKFSYFSGVFNLPKKFFDWFVGGRRDDENHRTVGKLYYSNSLESDLRVPNSPGMTYDMDIANQQNILGFHMPSHRMLPNYQQVQNIPFSGIAPESSFNTLIHETYTGYRGGNTGNSLLYQLKQMLAAWAAIGEGNSILAPRKDQLDAYNGFIEVLHKVLPKEIGFTGLEMVPPEVLVKSKTGKFILDSASGGLITLIEIAALIYTCSLQPHVKDKRFVVTFDEPENHLHPSLQRALLPTLVDAFPRVQFIVATHSPFMVGSLKDSAVYVLRYTDTERLRDGSGSVGPDAFGDRAVVSLNLASVDRAGTASDILREVLGVPVTVPQWVEDELSRLIEKYERQRLDKDTIARLRAEVEAAGLSDFFSDAVSRIAARQ